MHSRLYIHLQPLQAAENSLVVFDPSTQLFIEVVEVPKPFCIRHNFNWWAKTPLGKSGGKISRMLGSLEDDVAGVKLLCKICTVGVQLHGLSSLKRKRTINNWHNYFFSPFFPLSQPSTEQLLYTLVMFWELKPIAAYNDERIDTLWTGHQARTGLKLTIYISLFYIANFSSVSLWLVVKFRWAYPLLYHYCATK